jgi:hypothetical protein
VPPVGRIESHLSAPFFRFLVFTVSVLILRELFRRDGDELGKKKEVFVHNNAHIQKPPPGFTQTSHIGRIKEITGPYYSKFWEAKNQRTDGKN